jgi:hypothetical protein
MSKGSARRPLGDAGPDEVAAEFDRIFGQREATPIPLYEQDNDAPTESPDWRAKGT